MRSWMMKCRQLFKNKCLLLKTFPKKMMNLMTMPMIKMMKIMMMMVIS